MSSIDYTILDDEEKLDLLRLLYHDIKVKPNKSEQDIRNKEVIVAETQRVYSRIKMRSH